MTEIPKIPKKQQKMFGKFIHKAQYLLRDKHRIETLIKDTRSKIEHEGGIGGTWDKFVANVQLFLRMLIAYKNGEYKSIPWKTILLMTGSLLYFLSPIDFIPDMLVMVGLMDDITLLLWVASSVQKDLENFKMFENATQKTLDVEIDEDM